MTITKTSDQVRASDARRREGNKGCDVCPCCYKKDGVVENGSYHRLGRGSFHCTAFRVDKFTCLYCGAEWEGDPYLE